MIFVDIQQVRGRNLIAAIVCFFNSHDNMIRTVGRTLVNVAVFYRCKTIVRKVTAFQVYSA